MNGAPLRSVDHLASAVLVGVVRMGADGEVVLPEAVRQEAGLWPGSQVLLVRSPGGLGGLVLVEPGHACRMVDETLRNIARLRESLALGPDGEECHR